MPAHTYPYGYAGQRGTIRQIRKLWHIAAMDRETRRRMFYAMRLARLEGVDLGPGQGARSAEQNDAEFRRRHYVVPAGTAGAIYAWGLWWKRRDGMAPIAPSFLTYHADNAALAPSKGALAVDMVGDVAWLDRNAHRVGLRSFLLVNREIWHYIAANLPDSRRDLRPSMFPLERLRLRLRDLTVRARLATVARNRPVTRAPEECYLEPPEGCVA